MATELCAVDALSVKAAIHVKKRARWKKLWKLATNPCVSAIWHDQPVSQHSRGLAWQADVEAIVLLLRARRSMLSISKVSA